MTTADNQIRETLESILDKRIEKYSINASDYLPESGQYTATIEVHGRILAGTGRTIGELANRLSDQTTTPEINSIRNTVRAHNMIMSAFLM